MKAEHDIDVHDQHTQKDGKKLSVVDSSHNGKVVPQHKKRASKCQEIDPANAVSDEDSSSCNFDAIVKGSRHGENSIHCQQEHMAKTHVDRDYIDGKNHRKIKRRFFFETNHPTPVGSYWTNY